MQKETFKLFKHKVQYISSTLLTYHFFCLKHGVMLRFVDVVYFCLTFDRGGQDVRLSKEKKQT